ncbi:MAG TPA: carboxypeptidase regulatory-like domain-containing protein [Planctomycetota bacterium]|nr:carboxypeptidase regulatory-like domain-containing protein [Planctomycetota bacterium]
MKHVMMALAVMAGTAQAQDKEKAKEEGATVTGQVKLKGEAGRVKNVPLNDECKALHGDKPLKSEALVVDGEKNVKWAVVYITSGLQEGKTYEAPKEPVVVDQDGCCYKPHVLGIMVGQPLKVKNSDPLAHNVHGLPFINKEFNFMQLKGQENIVTFRKPESPIKVKCDIHNWMWVWAHAFDHPYFAVTDDAGKFTIRDLPPGKYTLEVWHETCTKVIQEIEVKAKESKVVNFELEK